MVKRFNTNTSDYMIPAPSCRQKQHDQDISGFRGKVVDPLLSPVSGPSVRAVQSAKEVAAFKPADDEKLQFPG